MPRDLTHAQVEYACHAILKMAFREIGGQTRNLAAEVRQHRGAAYEASPGFLKQSTEILLDTKSYRRVKRAFHYAPLPQAIVFLVEKLEESETKWTKVADRLSRVPQPTKLLRILDTYSPSVPKGISLPNGFEQDTPDVIALLEELRELYIEGEQVVDKFLDDSA